MKTYCQIGDLTRIVDPGEHYGRHQRVTGMFINRGEVCWRVDPPLPPFTGMADFVLRPVASPGDDEVDVHDVRLGERAAPEERTPVLVGQGAES